MRRRKLEPWSARDQWEVEVAGCGLGWHHSRWALAKGEIWVMYFTINTMLLGLGVGDAAERAGGSCIDLSLPAASTCSFLSDSKFANLESTNAAVLYQSWLHPCSAL